MNDVKLSVIVPVYNTAKYLRQCLDSLLEIPLVEKEIIAVNDGSTDESLNILEEYASKILLINTENSGLSAARNEGISVAHGEYLLFVDSDDFVISSQINAMIHYADKYVTDILYADCIKCDESGRFLKSVSIENLNPSQVVDGRTFYSGKNINDASIIMAQLKLCRRSFLITNNIYFEKGIYHEDVLFSFWCSKYANRVMYLNSIFYVYRQRESSIMHTPSLQKQIHKFYIINCICSNLSKVDSEFWRNFVVAVYFDVLRKSKIKNKKIYKKILNVGKLRSIQLVKIMLILFLQINAKEKEVLL